MSLESSTTEVPRYDTLEFIKTGSDTINVAANTDSLLTIPHNLGYMPVVLAYSNDTVPEDTSSPLPMFFGLNMSAGSEVVPTLLITWSVDETNLFIYAYNATTLVTTYPIRYYLFRVVAKNI
jgi:hypothetical protein